MVADRDDLQLIELFYAAVTDQALWPVALAHATEQLRSDHGFLLTNAAARDLQPFRVAAGLDEGHLARFFSPAAMNGFNHLVNLLPRGRPVQVHDLPSALNFHQSSFYNDIIRPTGGYHSASIQQDRPAENLHLTICRSRAAGGFTPTETGRMARLLPHLTGAFETHRRLRVAESVSEGLAGLLDRLDEGVILIDGSGRAVFANRAATRLVPDIDAFFLGVRRQSDNAHALPQKLGKSVMSTSAPMPITGQRCYFSPTTDGTSLIVDIVPVGRFGFSLAGAGAPFAGIFVREATTAPTIDQAALADIFKLSPRERDIATLLAAGNSTDAIATRLGLTNGTVRFNLKAIFGKTGTHSQAALVALLHSSAIIRRMP